MFFSLLCSGFQAWSNAFYWTRHADIQMMFRWDIGRTDRIDICICSLSDSCCCDPSSRVWSLGGSVQPPIHIRVPVPASQGRCRGNNGKLQFLNGFGSPHAKRVESHQYSTIPWACRSHFYSDLVLARRYLDGGLATDKTNVLTPARVKG